MNEITKSVLIIAATICFLGVAVLYRNVGRFQPVSDNVQLAIDTHTGQICLTGGDKGLVCANLAQRVEVNAGKYRASGT